MEKLRLLNPVGECMERQAFDVPGFKDLNNKRIGLFWNGKHHGDVALLRIAEHLKKHFKVKELTKFDYTYEGIGVEAIKGIVEKSDVVISALGD